MRRTHGMSGTKIYCRWFDIKRRCNDERCAGYEDYGGRGIKVCDEWKNDFSAFYDYVSKLPHFGEEGRSIDRINNDGNYEPGNVRWATTTEQLRNRRPYKTSVMLTFNGETKCLAAMAKKYGIKEVTVRARYSRGLPIEKVLYPGDIRTTKKKRGEKNGVTDQRVQSTGSNTV